MMMKLIVLVVCLCLSISSLRSEDQVVSERGEYVGSEGDDILGGDSQNDYLQGVGGLDTVDGGSGDDKLDGGSGEDNLLGSSGNDYIFGGPDSDIIFGQSGDDEIYGEAGSDYIDGGSGDDYLDGGNDYDILVGGDGNDTLIGGLAHDLLYGNSGDDYLDGGIDNDYLEGGDGQDSLFGGLDSDTLIGGEENDILNGEEGDDDLRGGRGRDYLIGGPGDDFLSGDEHPDTYEFTGFFGHDRVYIGAELDDPGVAIFTGARPEFLFFRRDGDDLIVSRHYSMNEPFFPYYDSARFLGWFDPLFLREVHLFYTTDDAVYVNQYTTSGDAARLANHMNMIRWSEDLSLEDIAGFYAIHPVSTYWYCIDPSYCLDGNRTIAGQPVQLNFVDNSNNDQGEQQNNNNNDNNNNSHSGKVISKTLRDLTSEDSAAVDATVDADVPTSLQVFDESN